MQNRLPSVSASTMKSGSSGNLSQSTRRAPSDTRRSASASCSAASATCRSRWSRGQSSGRRLADLQRDHGPGSAGRFQHPGPAAEAAVPHPVAERGGPECLGPWPIGDSQHYHAEREHRLSPSSPSALSVFTADAQAGRVASAAVPDAVAQPAPRSQPASQPQSASQPGIRHNGPAAGKRLAWLDALRGIAALCVVFDHLT